MTIAQNEITVPAKEVQDALGFQDVTWRIVDNDPKLWETASFPRMLEMLQSLAPDEITFYAHGKGVGYMDPAKRRWCDTMYYFNLSSPALVDAILDSYDALGAYQWKNRFHAGSPWHYSGTFFWLRHKAIFSRNWRDIEPTMYGVEGYPGRHIPLERTFSLIDPPDSNEFLENWKAVQPDVAPIHGWTPETAELRFTEIKAHTFEWMQRHLDAWAGGEAARRDIVFS